MIPPELTIDTFEGSAWVGVVPFWISAIEQRLMPGIGVPSSFPEVNVCTYVVAGDRPGV